MRRAACFVGVVLLVAGTTGRAGAAGASSPAAAPRPAPGEDFFVDRDDEDRPFQLLQDEWFGRAKRDPDPLAALAEIGGLLAVGAALYWPDPRASAHESPPSLADRVAPGALRFYGDPSTTFVLKPLAGSSYYLVSRLSDLGVAQSALLTVLSSAVWEYALTWHEHVSLNDLVTTPFGGIPLGGFWFRLTSYLSSAPRADGWGNALASSTLGLPYWMHHGRSGPGDDRAALPPDDLGFSSAYSHDFRLRYEADSVQDDPRRAATWLEALAADAEIVAMAGFGLTGRFSTSFAEDNFTELHGRISFSPGGLGDAELRAEDTIAGFYAQSFDPGPHGPVGDAEMVGLQFGLRYVERRYPGGHDLYASTNLLGASGGVWLRSGALRARLGGDVHCDFAGVHSLALDAYRLAHGTRDLKSVMNDYGYQIELGPSGRVRAEIAVGDLVVGGYVGYSFYRAVGGRDARQETIAHDVEGEDSILEYGTSATARLGSLPAFVRGSAEWVSRASALGSAIALRRDQRLGMGLGLVF